MANKRKVTRKAKTVSWKGAAIALLVANIATLSFVFMSLALSPNDSKSSIAKFEAVMSDIDRVCQEKEIMGYVEQVNADKRYDETGKKMLEEWHRYDCSLLKGESADYQKDLNAWLKDRGLPSINKLDSHIILE